MSFSTTNVSAASPKCVSSPARVRHNPYARSSGSASSTPVDVSGRQASATFSESFSSMPPATPPTAVAPAAAMWPTEEYMAPVPDVYAQHQQMHVQPQQQQADYAMPAQFNGQQYNATESMPAYDAVDPSVAVMMYNAASQAAANAAAGRGGYMPAPHQQPQVQHQQQQVQVPARGGQRRSAPSEGAPSFEELQAMAESLPEHARTASGSSFIQAAIKDSQDPRSVELVWGALAPCLGDLLLDAHGCYVIKTLLERLPAQEVSQVLAAIARDEQLGFSICTHSLHTRRVVQHIIECIDGGFLCDLMARHCADVAMTQQGCIVMQRSMDHAPEGDARCALFESIATNLVGFAKDPFANYVVQHLMEVGERSETAGSMWKAFRGRVVELACNKFASNVIEKCLFHCTADVQHEILVEMYSVGHQMLFNMLQDSFGNYIIQSSIALATFRDVSLIDEALRPVLAHTPYGHKIEARLDRRLKGKPVTARALAPQADAVQQPAATSAPRASRGRKGQGKPAAVPSGESAW